MKKVFIYCFVLVVSFLAIYSCKENDPIDIVDNKVPVANAGNNQSILEGETVVLDGTASSDEDNSELRYEWIAPEGITLSSITDPKPSFMAPSVVADTDFLFTLTVSDGDTISAESSVIISVLQKDYAFIVNYGSYAMGGASISGYNYENNQLTNNFYQLRNDGLELLSNIQYAQEYQNNIYLLGNSNDQIIILNRLLQQTKNGISSSNLAKPRYCIGHGNYLYISCWGENPDWSEMPDTYISKFNIITNEVEQIFPVPGGPEGMTIVDDKLYVALNYKDSIAVLNLSSNVTTYIATPAVSSYLLKDNNNNLYATQVSTWTDFSTETGLALINTSSDQYVKTFPLEGVSSEYGSIISANNDFSEIYVLATQYDENWNITGAVFKFDVTAGTYTEFISGISGPKGVTVNPTDNKVYLFTSESITEGGMLKIYSPEGVKENEFVTGIYPFMALFL